MERARELIKQGKIKGYDVNEIYKNTSKLKREDGNEKYRHEFTEEC